MWGGKSTWVASCGGDRDVGSGAVGKDSPGDPRPHPYALGMNAVTPGCETRAVGDDPGRTRSHDEDALAATTAASSHYTPELVAGRYRPERMLGRGGAKEVWLAHDLTLERPVAIARALPGAAGEQVRERMRREARLMARLGDHPHVVTVFDAFDVGEQLHIVVRFMEGGSLAAALAAAPGGRMRVPEVLRTGRTVADALAHAHAHDVVHRDVKPDNIWLAADGTAGLGDFGIAVVLGSVESAGLATGTPYYQPPEQAAGAPPQPQTDVYALGATLWELLTGRPPFTGPDALALLGAHRFTAPEPPSRHAPGIPPELDALEIRQAAPMTSRLTVDRNVRVLISPTSRSAE